jgi:hypothetical protein
MQVKTEQMASTTGSWCNLVRAAHRIRMHATSSFIVCRLPRAWSPHRYIDQPNLDERDAKRLLPFALYSARSDRPVASPSSLIQTCGASESTSSWTCRRQPPWRPGQSRCAPDRPGPTCASGHTGYQPAPGGSIQERFEHRVEVRRIQAPRKCADVARRNAQGTTERDP